MPRPLLTLAALVYDYTPGPDSLRTGCCFPRRALPATPGVIEMTVRSGGRSGVEAAWYTPDGSVPAYDPYYALPLYGESLVITDRGVEVVIPRGCQGGFSPPAGTTHYVRVPRVGGDAQSYVPCSLQPSTAYLLAGEATVETPAGTFDTYIFESPASGIGASGTAREHWNFDAGLVQYDLLNAEGVLRGRLALASSNRLGTR